MTEEQKIERLRHKFETPKPEDLRTVRNPVKGASSDLEFHIRANAEARRILEDFKLLDEQRQHYLDATKQEFRRRDRMWLVLMLLSSLVSFVLGRWL